MPELAGASVGAGVEGVVYDDADADAGMDADADEIRHMIVKGVFSQDGEIRLIVQEDGDMELLLQLLPEGKIRVGGIGREEDLVFPDHAVDAQADSHDAAGRRLQRGGHLPDNGTEKGDDGAAVSRIRVLLQAAVFPQKVGGHGGDDVYVQVDGENMAAGGVKSQEDGLAAHGGIVAPHFDHQLFLHQLQHDGGNGSFGKA